MKFNADDLVAQGLVTKKTYDNGLSIYKYKNKVFYDNLWHVDSRLLECRGIVVDSEYNIVIWPFTKIFNRFENATDLPLDQLVCVPRKVNGFMAAASIYKGEVLVSTTGTLDSDFADIAKTHILSGVSKTGHQSMWSHVEASCLTLIFEICDNSDPHIVHETPGAYLIGARNITTGKMLSESQLDDLASGTNWNRAGWDNMMFNDVVKASKFVRHEGFVVRDTDTGELLLKIKSPHYLVKKFFVRGGDKKWNIIWDSYEIAKQRVDEEYYGLLEWIRVTYTKEDWSSMSSQERRVLIEDYFSTKEDLE